MIILASASPRRQEILRYLYKDFTVIKPDCDENSSEPTAPGRVLEVAARKAKSVFEKAGGKDTMIIAADTLVGVDRQVLGKPRDEDDARRMLNLISGRIVQVYTGVCVYKGDEPWSLCERTDVTFCSLKPKEIDSYIATGEPMDKAGAFGAQGRGALFISRIQGDFYNVCGLPIAAIYKWIITIGT